MATGVGLHIAEYACTAAVVDDDGDPHFILREPVLHMSEEGDAVLGGAVAPPGHTHTITGFVAAVGDPAGVVVDDGEAYRGEDLLATALFCLINLTADHLNGPAEFYATHPAGWPPAQVLALRGALDYLGLKSVALVGEDELPARPAGLTPAETARYFAESAGRAALAIVLETPAGATPPDPTTAQNSALDTIVMPKLRDGDSAANKAYSAMVPAMDPEATYGGPSLAAIAAGLSPAAEPATGARPATGTAAALSATAAAKPAVRKAAAPRRDKSHGGARRTAALVAAAAIGGLLIGALGVTAILRPGAAEPGDPVTTSTSEAPPAPPPAEPQPVAPLPDPSAYTPEPTYDPEPTYTEEPTVAPPPPVTPTETIPEYTTVPPTTTGEPTGPTLTEPTTETETTTTRTRPRFFPFPVPFQTEDPEVDLPDTGSKEGGQEEAR
ncbi:hypothetical protein [Nocardia sp. NPDC003963]